MKISMGCKLSKAMQSEQKSAKTENLNAHALHIFKAGSTAIPLTGTSKTDSK